MNFEEIICSIARLGLNLYDFAMYSDGRIQTHRFQPCNNCNNSYSVAKAFVVTAVGLLWDDGKLNVTDSLYNIFHDSLPENADPGWRLATIEHALTHRLGFNEGFLDIDVDDTNAYPTTDYLQLVLSHSLVYLPGLHYQYSDAAYYLLSRVVSQVAEESMSSLLLHRIFRPMEFREIAWSCCPEEYPIGATGLYISAEDMVKLGALYLHGGVWNGRRLISREWVDKVLANEYEFHAMTSNGLIGKGGMYGQALVFSREKNTAFAWHAHIENGQSRQLVEYIDEVCKK